MPTFQPETKPHVRENITRCFREATRIIAAYEPPRDWAEEGMRAVLLRAREGRRVGGKNDGEEEDGMMGWRDYAGGRVVNEDDVVEIAGSHFTVFEKGNVSFEYAFLHPLFLRPLPPALRAFTLGSCICF